MRNTIQRVALAGACHVLICCAAAHAAASHGPDFNGDGFPDLVVGVPDEGIGSVPRAGLFHVIYGSESGLTTDGVQVFSQDSDFMPGQVEPYALFGVAFGWGDFNGDGFDDLAISARGQTIGSAAGAGSVTVLHGSADGLTTDGLQYWHLDVPGTPNKAMAYDQFGAALSAADFNADGFADLAIGVPNKRVDGASNAGAVLVLYGSSDGLTTTDRYYVHQNLYKIQNTAEVDDQFGRTLGSGDFNGDGFADLAIGAPGETNLGSANAGCVNVLYGSATGLRWQKNQFWRQRTDLMHNPTESGDLFGGSLAVGDFDGNGFDDLAIGVPGETLSGHANAGAVNVLYGSANRLTYTGNQFWHAGVDGLKTAFADDEQFGFKVAAGDFDGDGRDDLAIGVPRRPVSNLALAGAVQIIYGTADGLSVARARTFDQNTANIPDHAEFGDRFGYAIAARDFNADGLTDLAIGAPYNPVGSIPEAGVMHVLYGDTLGLTTVGNQFFTQDTPGLGDPAEDLDEFADYF
jgi:hypothetical protein